MNKQRAIDRAQATRNYRHYRKILTSKRLTTDYRVAIEGKADALAARYNLTTVRYTG